MSTTVALPSRAVVEPAAGPSRPTLRAVMKHIAINLGVATVIPSAIFALVLVLGSVWWALIAALTWCYSAQAWRMCTGRRTSGLVWLTLISLTVKTAVAFASGSTFIYFLQPVLTETAIALVFLGSLVTGRPLVARLAADFYPMDDELAARPRIRTLFKQLTLLWGVICAAKAMSSAYLLHTLSVSSYVAAKSVIVPSAAISGAALTILFAARVARREGLLPHRGRCGHLCLPEGVRLCPAPG